MLRISSGKNSEQLDLRSWEVSDLIGQEARIRIVDKHTGGWGHINVDEIKFSHEKARAQKEKAIWLDYGADNYAGVTWSDVKDGRRLFIGWMSNWQYANQVPSEKWRGAMTIPRSLSLHKLGFSYRVFSDPVEEVKKIMGKKSPLPSNIIHSAYVIDFDASGEFQIKLSNELEEEVNIYYDGETLSFDRSKSGNLGFSSVFKEVHYTKMKGVELKTIRLYVDVSSIEVFVNGGEMVMTEIIFPHKPYNSVKQKGNILCSNYAPIKTIW